MADRTKDLLREHKNPHSVPSKSEMPPVTFATCQPLAAVTREAQNPFFFSDRQDIWSNLEQWQGIQLISKSSGATKARR